MLVIFFPVIVHFGLTVYFGQYRKDYTKNIIIGKNHNPCRIKTEIFHINLLKKIHLSRYYINEIKIKRNHCLLIYIKKCNESGQSIFQKRFCSTQSGTQAGLKHHTGCLDFEPS